MATNKELKVTQFRYFGIGNENNFPDDEYLWMNGVDADHEREQKNLLSDYGNVVQLGIQGLPGTVFYLSESTPRGITIDHTGIYELDLRDTTARISSLYFKEDSLINIAKVDNAVLIVDVLYQGEGGIE